MTIKTKLITLCTIMFGFGAAAEWTHNTGGLSTYGPVRPNLNPNYKSQVQMPSEFNKSCEGYIKSDGTYGERAEKMKKEILGQGRSTNRTNYFFGTGKDTKGLDKYCPNFSRLSDDQKLDFWIWTMTIIAQFESGCNPDAGSPPPPNCPPYGETCGEFQTPRLEEGKPPSWRGPGCHEGEGYKTPDHQVGCAIEILGASLEGDYHKNTSTFVTEKGSHWEVIMETGKSNQKMNNQKYFENFPPCGYKQSNHFGRDEI